MMMFVFERYYRINGQSLDLAGSTLRTRCRALRQTMPYTLALDPGLLPAE